MSLESPKKTSRSPGFDGSAGLKRNPLSFPDIRTQEEMSDDPKCKSKHNSLEITAGYPGTPPSTPSDASKEDSHPLPSPNTKDDSTSIDLHFTGFENATRYSIFLINFLPQHYISREIIYNTIKRWYFVCEY